MGYCKQLKNKVWGIKRNNLSVIQYSKDLTVDSREVAELIGKDHSHLLRDIRKYCNVISTNPKLDLLDFFIACDYEDNKGEIVED